MVEEKIQTPDLCRNCRRCRLFSGKEGRWPGVILYTDIVGIRPSQEQMARRLSGAGYVVLMPNIFYRTGALPLFDFPPKFVKERTTKRISELRQP